MIKGSLIRAAAIAATTVLAGAGSASAFDLPGIFGGDGQAAAPTAQAEPQSQVRMAQAGSNELLRINQLEDEVRQLTGRVEDLNFQLLQTQEELRKFREDVEFRFQDLEGGGKASNAAKSERRGEAAPAPSSGSEKPTETASTSAPASSSGTSSNAGSGDNIGNLLQSGLGGDDAQKGKAPATDSNTVAAISPRGAGEMYDLAYNYLLAGDYAQAEQAFRQYAQTYPSASDAPDAEYWLGESLYQQQKFADAAEVFLDAQKGHPDASKAPEMMLKLGMSLAKLKNRETACVTYKEVARRYPTMSANVKRKLASEEKAANC